MKGRIAVVKEYGKPFEIEEYDVPEPQPPVSFGLTGNNAIAGKPSAAGGTAQQLVVVIGIAVMGHKSINQPLS